MGLTDRQAADLRKEHAVSKAYQTLARHKGSNRQQPGLGFRNGLTEAVRELKKDLLEIYAELDGASEEPLRDELVKVIGDRLSAFIQSSVAGERGTHALAAAREGARLISMSMAGIGRDLDLAVHARTKRETPSAASAPPAAPVRLKQDKFGILDSPRQYDVDFEPSVGSASDEDNEKPDLPMRNLSVTQDRIERDSGITVYEKLNIGAYADVWRGEDKLGRPVAIKFVRPSMEGEVSAMDHARALARAAHPNVVTLFTVERMPNPETGAEQDAIVMEFLEGETFEERVATHFTMDEVAEYSHGLINGIEHIHASGLTHGDLHEANIILSPRGLKIIDILYRDTLAILGTSTREQRLRIDLRRTAEHIHTMFENSALSPSSASEFQAALGGPVKSVEQIRSALNQVLSNTISNLTEPVSVPAPASAPLENVSALVPVRNGDDIGSADILRMGTGGRVQWRTPTGAFAFLKFRPIKSMPTMTQYHIMAHIKSNSYRIPYMGHASGFNYSYSKFGGTLFANMKDNSGQDYAEEVSVLCPNGEVLLLDGSFMLPGERQPYWDAIWLEGRFTKKALEASQFYDACFDSPRLEIAIGLCGLSESVLALGSQTSDPTYINELGYRWLVQDHRQLVSEIKEFFNRVWQHYGIERPARR